MNPAESLALLACLVASAWLLVRAAIHNAMHAAKKVINDAIQSIDQPYPTTADALAHKWAEIREDFADDEFELLRRADRMMAGVEERVLREWQDMPYDHEIWGL